jgi:hypothetical protein
MVYGTLLISNVDDMKAAGIGAPPTSAIPIVGAALKLTVEVNKDGGINLCARLASPPPGAEGLPQELLNEFHICNGINLHAALVSMAHYLPDVLNGGIATNGQAVAIRFDTDPPTAASASAWTAFFNGEFPDRLGLAGHDWAIFVPQALMVQFFEGQFTKYLEEDDTAETFNLLSGPDVTWLPLGPFPRAFVTLSGEVIDACAGIDMNVDVTIAVRFSVPEDNTLRVRTVLSYSTSIDEDIACVLALVLATPIFLPMTLIDNDIKNAEWWSLLGVFVDWPWRLIGVIAYMKSDAPLDNLPDMSGWVEVSGTERYKDIAFPSDAGLFGGALTLQGVLAEPDGVVLFGGMTIEDPLQMELKVYGAGFDGWYSEDVCHDPFAFVGKMWIHFGGQPIGAPPRLPIRCASIGVVKDPVDTDPMGQYGTDHEGKHALVEWYLQVGTWVNGGSFEIVPWFVDRVRLGSLYAGLSPDRRAITIWQAVETRTGLEPPVRLEDIRNGRD